MAFHYLNDTDSAADLASRMKEDDKPAYADYGHTRIEAVFDSRLFIIYKPRGLEGAAHRDPEVIAVIKILDYACSSREGSTIEIENMTTGERQLISHVPARVFDYDLFMSVPPALRLRWDVRADNSGNGKMVRSLSYAVLIRSKNRSDWFSQGVCYAETPNRFRELFPNFDFQPNHY